MQVGDEFDCAWERLDGWPEEVLLGLAEREVGIDREVRREVGEEREEVRCSFSFGCITSMRKKLSESRCLFWSAVMHSRLPIRPALMSHVISLPYFARMSSYTTMSACQHCAQRLG